MKWGEALRTEEATQVSWETVAAESTAWGHTKHLKEMKERGGGRLCPGRWARGAKRSNVTRAPEAWT